MPDVYDVGDQATATVTFINTAGSAVNPGTVRLDLWPPGAPGTTLAYGTPQTWGSIAQDGVGTFSCRWILSAGGYWRWAWSGTGGVASAVQGRIFVRYPHIDPPL